MSDTSNLVAILTDIEQAFPYHCLEHRMIGAGCFCILDVFDKNKRHIGRYFSDIGTVEEATKQVLDRACGSNK